MSRGSEKRVLGNTIHIFIAIISAGACFYAGRDIFSYPVLENIGLVFAGVFCLWDVLIHSMMVRWEIS